MNAYHDTLQWLFSSIPAFERQGAGGYKPGLERTLALAELFGNPQQRLRFIHIAGTNGKGSTAHSLAAVLQAAGLRTGLFTSPHLVDFRERIRLNGTMISPDEVVSFTERFRANDSGLQPSFFELTTVMALEWFERQSADVVVLETGLGGRLDSTNIVTPLLSVITGVALDHTDLLGDTLARIAYEKAGILKPGIPAVVGAVADEAREVIATRADALGAPLYRADAPLPYRAAIREDDSIRYEGTPWGTLRCDLTGGCQPLNMAVILTALQHLPFTLSADVVAAGLRNVAATTGLRGRWTMFSRDPLTIYDIGHNPDAWRTLVPRLTALSVSCRRLILGFVSDKDVSTIVAMLRDIPRLQLYLTAPATPRALPAERLGAMAAEAGLQARVFPDVAAAYAAARAEAAANDLIYIGGSNYLCADWLRHVTDT